MKMKKIATLFTGIAAIIFLIAGTTLNAETVKINRPVDGITNITLACYGNLYITQGNENNLTIETTKKNENNLICKKEGDTLILKTKNSSCSWSSFFGLFSGSNNDNLTYYLTLKNINKIKSEGSGNITARSDINSKNLKLKLQGSGNFNFQNITASNIDLKTEGSGNFNAESIKVKNNINLKLDGSSNIEINSLITNSLNSELDGSGNIKISGGTAKSQYSSVDGSGNYTAPNLISETANIDMEGSGDITVNVIKSMSIETSGSGDLKVIGKPSISSLDTSGSGSLDFNN